MCVCVCVLENTVLTDTIKTYPILQINSKLCLSLGFPGGSVVKNTPVNAGVHISIPRLGRSPGEGNGNLLQYSFLGNPMDRGA